MKAPSPNMARKIAREDVPALVAEVRRLQADNERLRRAKASYRQIAVERGEIMFAAEAERDALRAAIQAIEKVRENVDTGYYGMADDFAEGSLSLDLDNAVALAAAVKGTETP